VRGTGSSKRQPTQSGEEKTHWEKRKGGEMTTYSGKGKPSKKTAVSLPSE